MESPIRLNESRVKVAAIWGRVSTDGQRELSLDSQEVAARKALEAQGYEVPPQHVLKVDWSSLDLMSCPEFQQLRRWIADGTVQAVGTLDRDRLQAQGLQRLIFLSECKDKGVQIITVQGPQMLEGGEGQLVELALALGKEKSVLRAQRGAKDGMRDRAVLKHLPPTDPSCFGMTWNGHQLVPNEQYAVAHDIWRMALEGWKIAAIAAELTRRGIPTPGGRQGWWPWTVRHILRNRSYAGVVEALKTEAVEPKVRRSNSYGKSAQRVRPVAERVRLEGLVVQPVVTEAEYQWMQERLAENQRLAKKNTRLRSYLLKGRICCAVCGRTYVGVTRNKGSLYVCSARWKPRPSGERCPSCPVVAETVEETVYALIGDFLRSPEGFEAEARRRSGMVEQTEESLREELASLERQEREEHDAEARAFRLVTRGAVSEQVYAKENAQILLKLRWTSEQRERLARELDDLARYRFDGTAIELLRDRLESRLASANAEDRRFIVEALDARVIVQEDGSWELEVHVPRSPHPGELAPQQIVNSEACCAPTTGYRRCAPTGAPYVPPSPPPSAEAGLVVSHLSCIIEAICAISTGGATQWPFHLPTKSSARGPSALTPRTR